MLTTWELKRSLKICNIIQEQSTFILDFTLFKNVLKTKNSLYFMSWHTKCLQISWRNYSHGFFWSGTVSILVCIEAQVHSKGGVDVMFHLFCFLFTCLSHVSLVTCCFTLQIVEGYSSHPSSIFALANLIVWLRSRYSSLLFLCCYSFLYVE